MVRYSIPTNPNFTISCAPEGVMYTLLFKSIRNLMYVIIQNDMDVRISGPIRVCEGEWLIPYEAYKGRESGNFMVVEATEQYPTLEVLNSSCELRYYTKDEIKLLKNE